MTEVPDDLLQKTIDLLDDRIKLMPIIDGALAHIQRIHWSVIGICIALMMLAFWQAYTMRELEKLRRKVDPKHFDKWQPDL